MFEVHKRVCICKISLPCHYNFRRSSYTRSSS